MYIQANIGRNYQHEGDASNGVTTEAFSDFLWARFQEDTKNAIQRATRRAMPDTLSFGDAFENFEVHTGTGTWNGVTEESAHVSLYLDHDGFTFNGGTYQDHKPALRLALGDALQRLAHTWHQEAIAYLVTDSALALSSGDHGSSRGHTDSHLATAGE